MDFHIDTDKLAERAFNEQVQLTKGIYDKEHEIKNSLTYDVDFSDYYADMGKLYRNGEQRRKERVQRYKDFGNGYLYTNDGNTIQLDPYSFEDRIKFADTMHALYPEYTTQYFLDNAEDWIYQTTGQKVNVKTFNEHLENTWNMAWANVSDSLDTFSAYLSKPFSNDANYALTLAKNKERVSNSEGRYDKSKVDRQYDGFLQKIVSGGVAQAPQFISSLASGIAGFGIGTVATKLGISALTSQAVSKAVRLGGTFLFSALNEAGGAMSDLREMGFSDNAVIGAGLGIGLATGVLEAWGSDKILSPIEDTANKIFKIKDGDLVRLGTNNFLQYMKERGVDTLKDIAKGEITEVAEEELEYLASLPMYFLANEYEKKYGNGGVSNEELGLTVDNILKNMKETAIETAYSTPLMTLSSNVISTGLDVSVFRNRQSFTPYSYMNNEGATNVIPTDNIVLSYTVDKSLKEDKASPIPVRVVGSNVFVEGTLTPQQDKAIKKKKVVFIKEDETKSSSMSKEDAYRIVEEKKDSPKMSISPSSVDEVLFFTGLEDRIDKYTFIDKKGKFSENFDKDNTTFMALKFKNGQEELIEISKDNADSDINETLLLKRGGFSDEEIVVILAKREIDNLRKEDETKTINESAKKSFWQKAKLKLSDLKKAIFEKTEKNNKEDTKKSENNNTENTAKAETNQKETNNTEETTKTEKANVGETEQDSSNEIKNETSDTLNKENVQEEDNTVKEEVDETKGKATSNNERISKKKLNNIDKEVKERIELEKANEETITEEEEGENILKIVFGESDKENDVDTGIEETIEEDAEPSEVSTVEEVNSIEEPSSNETQTSIETLDEVNDSDTTAVVDSTPQTIEEADVKKTEPQIHYRKFKEYAVTSKIKEGETAISYKYIDKNGNTISKDNATYIEIEEKDGEKSRIKVKGLKESSLLLLEKYASNDNANAKVVVDLKNAVKKLETLEELGVEVIDNTPQTVKEVVVDTVDSKEEPTKVEEKAEAVNTEEQTNNIQEETIKNDTKEENVEEQTTKKEDITLNAVDGLSKKLQEISIEKDKADKLSTATVGIANALKSVPYFKEFIKYDEKNKVSNALYRNGAETYEIVEQAVINYVKANGSNKSLSEIISGVIASNNYEKNYSLTRLAFRLMGIDDTTYDFRVNQYGEEDDFVALNEKNFVQLERMLTIYLNGQELGGIELLLEQVCLDIRELKAIKEGYNTAIRLYPTENINEKASIIQQDAIEEELNSIIPPTSIDNQIKEIERIEENKEKKVIKLKKKKEIKVKTGSTEETTSVKKEVSPTTTETNSGTKAEVDTDLDIATTPSPYLTIRGSLDTGITEENLEYIKLQLEQVKTKESKDPFIELLYNLHSKLFTTKGKSNLESYNINGVTEDYTDTFRVAKLIAKTQTFGDDTQLTNNIAVFEELVSYSIASLYDEYCIDKANITPNRFFTAIIQHLSSNADINSLMKEGHPNVTLEGLMQYFNTKAKELGQNAYAPYADINSLDTYDYEKNRRSKYKRDVKKALKDVIPSLSDEEYEVLSSLYSAVYPNYSVQKLTNDIIKNIPVDELTVIKGATSTVTNTIMFGEHADVSTVVHELFHAVFSARKEYANQLISQIRDTLNDTDRKGKFSLFLMDYKNVWKNEKLDLSEEQILERFENHIKDYDGENVSIGFEEDLARLWIAYSSSNSKHQNLDKGIRKVLNKLKKVLSDFYGYIKTAFALDSGISNALDNLMFSESYDVLEQEYRDNVQSKDFALSDIRLQIGELGLDGYVNTSDIALGKGQKDYVKYNEFVETLYNGIMSNAQALNSKNMTLLCSLYAKYGNIPMGVESEIMQGLIDEGAFKNAEIALKDDATETGFSDTVTKVFRMLCATNDDYMANYTKIKGLLYDFKNGSDKQKALTNILGYLYGTLSSEEGTIDCGLLTPFYNLEQFFDPNFVAYTIFNQDVDYMFSLDDVNMILKPVYHGSFCEAVYSPDNLGDFKINLEMDESLEPYTNPDSVEVQKIISFLETMVASKDDNSGTFYSLRTLPKGYYGNKSFVFGGTLVNLCNIKHNDDVATRIYYAQVIQDYLEEGIDTIFEDTDYTYLTVAQSNLYAEQMAENNMQEVRISNRLLLGSIREVLYNTKKAIRDNVYNGKLSVNTKSSFVENAESEVKRKVEKATKEELHARKFQDNVSKTLATTQEIVKSLEETVNSIDVKEQETSSNTTKGGETAVKNTVTALTHAKKLISDKIKEYKDLFKEKDNLFIESTYKEIFDSNNIKEFNKIEKELQRRLEKLNSLMNEALVLSQNETKSDRSLKKVINYINKTIEFVSTKCISKYNPLLDLLREDAEKTKLQKESLEMLKDKLEEYGLATHLRNTRKQFKELGKSTNKPVGNKLRDIYNIFQERQVKRNSDNEITGFKGESHKGKSLSFTGLFTAVDSKPNSEYSMLDDANELIHFIGQHDMIVIDPANSSRFYVNKQMSDLTIKELAEFYNLAKTVSDNGKIKVNREVEFLRKNTERFEKAVVNEIKSLGKERNIKDFDDFIIGLGLGSAGEGTKQSLQDVVKGLGSKALSDFEIISVKYRNRFPLLYTFIFGGDYSFTDENGVVNGIWGGINAGMENVNVFYGKRSRAVVNSLVEHFSGTRYAEYKYLNIDNIERDLPMICSSWKTTLENVTYDDGRDIDSVYIERNHSTVDELGNVTPNKNWESVYDYLFALENDIKKTQLKVDNTIKRIENLKAKRVDLYSDFEKRVEIDKKIDRANETLKKAREKLETLESVGKRPHGYPNINLYTTQQLIGIYMIARQEGGLNHLLYNFEQADNPNAPTGNNLTIGEVVWVMEQIDGNEDYEPLKQVIETMGSEINSRIDAIKKKKLEITGVELDEIDYYFTFLGEERVDTYTKAYDMSFDLGLDAETNEKQRNVDDSFTKDRTSNNRALSLDAIGNFFKSLYKQEYYIGMASEVKAIKNLVNSNDFKRSMEYYYGKEEGDLNVRQLQKYASNLARRPKLDETFLAEAVRFMTANTARASLSFSITTILQQFPTILYCATELGLEKTMNYVLEYFRDMKANSLWVYGNSAQMKNRASSYQMLGSQRVFANKKLQKVDSMLSTVSAIGTKWLNEVDTHVANAMWYAYYYNELEKNKNNVNLSIEEAEIVSRLEATQKVMDISPSVSAKDNSNAFNNKDSFLRQMLLFQNQPSKMFYMLVNAFADKDITNNGWDNFTRVAGITATVVALSVLIKGGMLPSTSDDDDKESYFSKITKEFTGELFNLIPVVGSSLGEMFTGSNFYDSTVISTLGNLYKVLNKDRDERTDAQLANAFAYFVSTVGEMVGAPSNAFNKVYRFIRDGFNFGQLYNYKLGEYWKDEGFLWL